MLWEKVGHRYAEVYHVVAQGVRRLQLEVTLPLGLVELCHPSGVVEQVMYPVSTGGCTPDVDGPVTSVVPGCGTT